jgi:N-acetylglutamate synthase-like GNAT family acetyltransferase
VNDSYWLEQKPFFIDSPASRERINLHEWNKILSDPHQKAYVLQQTVTKHVVGVVVLEIPPQKEYGKFGIFAVAESYQGKKLGHILIDYVEQIAKKLSKHSMKIEVFVFAKRLQKYYKKLGYVFTGKTNSFFHSECIKPEYRDIASQYLQELEKIL